MFKHNYLEEIPADVIDIIDKYIKVTDKESAHMAREISKTEGLFVGV